MSTPWLSTRGRHRLFFLVLASLVLPAGAWAVPPAGDSEVAMMDALALEENLSLRAYDSRARQSSQQARFEEERWPQPMLEYMLDVSAPWAPHFQTGHTVRLRQSIPRRGARQAQAAPARAEEEAVRLMQVEASVDVLRDIRLFLVEMSRIDARIALLREEIELIDDALGVVEAIIPVGRADHSDLLQLELARETALDEIADLRARRVGQKEGLGASLGVSQQRIDEIGLPEDILQDWFIELPTSRQLALWAHESGPGMARIEAEAAVADARIEVLDQRVRPWPTIVAGYSNMPPMWEMEGRRDQMFQIGFSIELPIFRNQYGIEASTWQAAHQALEEERDYHETQVAARVESILAEWESDRSRLQRHEQELLPLAGDLARQILIGMELGERNASDFLLALRQEIDLERRIINLRAGLLREMMELQRLTGGRLGEETAWAYPADIIPRHIGGQR